MKAFLCTALFMLIGSLVFSEERIAVFPFQDMDNILTRNQAFVFYSDFTNEFANRSRGKFSVVPRQDVDRLIQVEADFQLTIFSAEKKTAEMMRVQNATRILSGSIIKLDNNIRISVSLYTYPELVQLPGGTNLTVTNTTELFNKIPDLVQRMMNTITPPKRPIKWPPGFLKNYSFFNGLTIFGYTYSFDTPLGFTLGIYGIYTSLGFALPDWGDYEKVESDYSGSSRYSSVYPPDYNKSPILDQRYQIIDWVIGYNVTIIKNVLYLPLGVGMENVKEWRLQNVLDYDGKSYPSSYEEPEWNPAPQWSPSFLFEIGLLLRISTPINLGPYIFGTYRNIGIKKHSFSIGIGISLDFIHDDW